MTETLLIGLLAALISTLHLYRLYTDPGPGQIELAIHDVASAIRALNVRP